MALDCLSCLELLSPAIQHCTCVIAVLRIDRAHVFLCQSSNCFPELQQIHLWRVRRKFQKRILVEMFRSVFTYPISQGSDITAFKITVVPAGESGTSRDWTGEDCPWFQFHLWWWRGAVLEPDVLLPENEACICVTGNWWKKIWSRVLGMLYHFRYGKVMSKRRVCADPTHIQSIWWKDIWKEACIYSGYFQQAGTFWNIFGIS